MGESDMDDKAAEAPDTDIGPAGYYHSQKDRIFVRAIQGEYNLTKELERLRAMPRVRKAPAMTREKTGAATSPP